MQRWFWTVLFSSTALLAALLVAAVFFYSSPRWLADDIQFTYIIGTNDRLYIEDSERYGQRINLILMYQSSIIDDKHFVDDHKPHWQQRFLPNTIQGQPVMLASAYDQVYEDVLLGGDLLLAKDYLCFDHQQQSLVLSDSPCAFANEQELVSYDIFPAQEQFKAWMIPLEWNNQSTEVYLTTENFALSVGNRCSIGNSLKHANRDFKLTSNGKPIHFEQGLFGRHIGSACYSGVGINFYRQQDARFAMIDQLNRKLVIYR